MRIKQYKGKFISTSFHGDTIRTSCNKLVELFGNYHQGDPDKVNFEWSLILDDKIPFDIYDWKWYELTESMVIDYHIGARNEEESRLVKEELNKLLK